MAAPADELCLDFLVHPVQHYNALLGGTDHTVVKGLGVDHRGNRQQDIRGVVNDGGGIAGAHAQGGLSGGISGLHHAGAAGSQDQVGFPHQLVRHLQAGLVDPADDVLRRAGRHGSLQHHPGCGNGAALGSGVGADDDAVPGFQTNQCLKNGRRGGIGCGNHRSDHTDGLRNALGAKGGVLLNDAAGLGVLIGIVDILRSKVVLDDLVLHYAHAGLLYGQFCQRDPHLVGSGGSSQEDPVHLLLGIFGKLLLGRPAPGHSLGQLPGVGNGKRLFFHNKPSFALYQ